MLSWWMREGRQLLRHDQDHAQQRAVARQVQALVQLREAVLMVFVVPSTAMGTMFPSYPRAQHQLASELRTRLASSFGTYEIFKDDQRIQVGEDGVEALFTALADADKPSKVRASATTPVEWDGGTAASAVDALRSGTVP